MQPCGSQQGAGPGHVRSSATSASASPSSSSSAAFDQQQQQQRQSLQQQFLRRPEGNDATLAYQASNVHGTLFGAKFMSSGSIQSHQQSRNMIDLGQHHTYPSIQEQNHSRSQGADQQMNPFQQAYLQYSLQAAQQKSTLGIQSQQIKPGIPGPLARDQDMLMINTNQTVNQAQVSSSKKSSEQVIQGDKQADHGQRPASSDAKSSYPSRLGQPMPSPPMLGQQAGKNVMNLANNPMSLAAQMQAMQALALERNIDLSHPANANVVAQLIPLMQSKMVGQQKANESSNGVQSSPFVKQHCTSMVVANVSSPTANSSSDVSGQSGSSKVKPSILPGPIGATSGTAVINHSTNLSVQQLPVYSRDNQLTPRPSTFPMSGIQPSHTMQSPGNSSQGVDRLLVSKTSSAISETSQAQYAGQINLSTPHSATPSKEEEAGNSSTPPGGPLSQMSQSHGFTKQQLHVLKAQILAFRRLKKGEGTLPRELLQAIVPPPLDLRVKQAFHPPISASKDRSGGEYVDERAKSIESSEKVSTVAVTSAGGVDKVKEEIMKDDKVATSTVNMQITEAETKEPRYVVSPVEEHQSEGSSAKMEQGSDPATQVTSIKGDITTDRGKAVATQPNISDMTRGNKSPIPTNSSQPKETVSTRKYHGPLFDFPVFTRKHDSLGSSLMNNNNNLNLAYDIKDLFSEVDGEIFKRSRAKKIEKIGKILAFHLERKFKPDLVIRLQIESKKLLLAERQARLRDEIEQQQIEIMAMPDRPYRKFLRLCERQRQDLGRQSQANLKANREKQLKSIFQWRKKLLEAHWAIRDARIARNRGVHKYHERMLREFSKRKDDDHDKRMEALKNNDVERYREMLLEQQNNIPGEAAERYAVLSSFLTQTEEYLYKLGSKITTAKNLQEVEEAANSAAAAARAQGLSEEETRAAAACAREEVMVRNRFSEMNAPKDNSSVNKYYSLAHAVNERVTRQPSMLRAGTLRDYQLVGLQWMLSLYNNKLNGILADEMGLGKTVQVMSLIAYLMEFKGNYGPHLIIVPNAVLVNWKSELHNWLPTVSCIYYVGGKDQRSKLFSQEVLAMKFNVLVTTYEFVMYDRSKLSKVDWRYIIIDEAQRMKDRESVLARDLDRYRCQRRLLLTGTPLQNDLKELWSLLNLLLPEVFDNRKAFHDWFSQPFQKEAPMHNAEDDWLETEKKVIVIHRLHQILEPFMLRRRVEDVEGSLPPKVSIVLKCRMSAIQSVIYDWIKSTGTLRVDPEDEKLKIQKNPNYQPKIYKTLNNRCMELRKSCNHPLLNYPYFSDLSKDFLVRSCGKMWVLDRVLIKLHRTGHRVLLFSTMTKLLDIVEEYLQWRRLIFRRIDGTTSLEDRESAIVEFNRPDTDCFIFLLSIRAAGRGLNLQSADTVIIYDPDPNPKNEEQAVARAHRIGQTREVKVIYMEAVVDKISSHQKEDEIRRGGIVDSDDDLAGKDRYVGSIESLIRNNIQQYKIDMADEVINAGRFDQRTTHEERRLTLETLLHDEERYQETVHDVPSLHEVNQMIARSESEVLFFDQMDEDLEWAEDMTRYDQVPEWLRASTKEVNATVANLSKKASKNVLYGGIVGVDSSGIVTDHERKRGRPKGKVPIYTVLDDDEEEFSEASSDDRNEYTAQEGDIGEFDDDESTGVPGVNNDQSEEEGPVSCDGYESNRALECIRSSHMRDEAGSSGSSSHSQRLLQMVSPSASSQKFGSLSALDDRSYSRSKKLADELEEGEIVASGDSHMDHQQSGSWIQDRDEGEDEQVLQPKIKRKRSIRLRPRPAERFEEKFGNKSSLRHEDPSQLHFGMEQKFNARARDTNTFKDGEPNSLRRDKSNLSIKNKRSLPSRKNSNTTKLRGSLNTGASYGSTPDHSAEHPRDNWDNKVVRRPLSTGFKMSEAVQRKCKNVISKLQRRIDKEGHQIIPLLAQMWERIRSPYAVMARHNILDFKRIDLRIDKSEYSGIMEVVSDVQHVLKYGLEYFGFTYEVRSEAKKVHDLFFDILKIAFPDTDFREAKSSMSFSGPVSTQAVGSSKQALSSKKRQKLVKDVDKNNSPFQKPRTRAVVHTVEDAKARSYMAQKETKLGSNSSSRDIGGHENAHSLTHPGDLVICKKKRKDREKSAVKTGNRTTGPLSPAGPGLNIKSPSSIPGTKEMGLIHQNNSQQSRTALSPQGNSGGSSVGWANPVKRMRSDPGKRRSSHL